jgi:hypothetical protein
VIAGIASRPVGLDAEAGEQPLRRSAVPGGRPSRRRVDAHDRRPQRDDDRRRLVDGQPPAGDEDISIPVERDEIEALAPLRDVDANREQQG